MSIELADRIYEEECSYSSELDSTCNLKSGLAIFALTNQSTNDKACRSNPHISE